MKTITTIAAGALLAAVCGAQMPTQKSQEELIQLRDQKLASEWLDNAAWITDYDEALAEAQKSGKEVFAYFTRSYSP